MLSPLATRVAVPLPFPTGLEMTVVVHKIVRSTKTKHLWRARSNYREVNVKAHEASAVGKSCVNKTPSIRPSRASVRTQRRLGDSCQTTIRPRKAKKAFPPSQSVSLEGDVSSTMSAHIGQLVVWALSDCRMLVLDIVQKLALVGCGWDVECWWLWPAQTTDFRRHILPLTGSAAFLLCFFLEISKSTNSDDPPQGENIN